MRSRWFFISAAAAAVLAVWIAAYLELKPRPTNVIVLTMESARAEVLTPEVMPNVWRLAQGATRFETHRAVSGWTAANIVSLLTGLSPFAHGVHSRDQHVPAEWPLPLKDLSEAGWRVAGLQPFMQIEGFRNLGMTVEPGANLLGWLAARAQARQPFVLWYHYVDTHLPYSPPAAFRPDLDALLPKDDAAARARVEEVMRLPAIPAGEVGFQPSDRPAIRALYLADFRAFDAWFSGFWSFFERSGLRDNTILVLTADHGDELLERGEVGHASTTRTGNLHEEIVHVPLVIWLPPALRTSTVPSVVTEATDHLDLMPTIFSLLRMAPTRSFAGSNLFALQPRRVWRAVSSSAGFEETDPRHIAKFTFAEIEGRWKLYFVRENATETETALFNLEQDPGETRNLATVDPGTVDRLRDDVMPLIASMRLGSAATPMTSLKEQTPEWIFPKRSGTYRYDDLAGQFRLEWSGRPDGVYRVQYEAGQGALHLGGEFEVTGTIRDFGRIDRRYWEKWVVPYDPFRLRIGIASRDDRWSDWIELRAEP